jgi:hypothetical protein
LIKIKSENNLPWSPSPVSSCIQRGKKIKEKVIGLVFCFEPFNKFLSLILYPFSSFELKNNNKIKG